MTACQCYACKDTGYADYAAVPCEVCGGTSRQKDPPAPQPDPDPAVEAARRKALRAIFAALDWHHGCSDGHAVHLSAAILRDLVGLPRQGATAVPFYDDEADA